MVNLLSFEKFLSKYSPSKPIIPNNTELTPIKEPIDKSIISPNIILKFLQLCFPQIIQEIRHKPQIDLALFLLYWTKKIYLLWKKNII